jgi:predicted ATPase
MSDDIQLIGLTKALNQDLLATPFKVRTNWHVITGAQSSGKTTLINDLAGEGFQTVPEVARLFFERELAKGRTIEECLGDKAELERCLMALQLEIEADLPPEEVMFLDRGLPDCLTFYRAFGVDPNEMLLDCRRFRYASVFVLDRLPIAQDGLRIQDTALADFLDRWLPRDYGNLGYEVVRVPVLPPQDRVEFILHSLSSAETSKTAASRK